MPESFIIVGKKNIIDLSWNKPLNNGNTIKNYFFYLEDRTLIASPVVSYYSYRLPSPNIYNFGYDTLNANGGLDINSESHVSTTNMLTLSLTGFSNTFDLTYGGEIEISWFYHPDTPIVDICANTGTLTKMTINIFKENLTNNLNSRRYLLDTITRNYDSVTNKLGPTPLNNYPFIVKDIFSINTDISGSSLYKIFNRTDKIILNISMNSLSYNTSTSASITDTRNFSIIIKECKFAPYRIPFSQRFTSLSFWNGTATGLLLNKNNALSPIAGNDSSGCLYYMPKMINIMKKYEKATISFSWSYDFDLSMSATDLSFCGITDVSMVNFPYSIRIRGYSRPFLNSATVASSYNTTSIADFISNSTNTQYSTYSLFDISRNYTASYADIKKDVSNNSPVFTHTIDLSGLSFPLVNANLNDPSHHSQFVFIISLCLNTSLPVYSLPSNKLFSIRYLSYNFTPYQYYHFTGPDPTLTSSNELTSTTSTVYDITNPYTNITSYYSIYNLINGSEYAIKIAANNMFGTSNFSSSYANRCGSVPDKVYSNNYSVESYNQNKKISIIWDKPVTNGYEITKYRIEYFLDISSEWLNKFDYVDLSFDTIVFNMFKPIDLSVQGTDIYSSKFSMISHDSTIITYRYLLDTYEYASPPYNTGPVVNGKKYYVRMKAYNDLGSGEYSPIVSGVPLSVPDLSDGFITFPSSQIIKDDETTFTWTVPIGDGGAPILDYLIEFASINSLNKIGDYQPYYIDSKQPLNKLNIYKDIIVNKNIVNIESTKLLLQSYLIPPTPITLYEVDRNNINIINNPSLSKYIDISNANVTYRYTSSILDQNDFDISYIQLKWYYLQNNVSGSNLWNGENINFNLSFKVYLVDVNSGHQTHILSFPNEFNNISYNVTSSLLSGINGNGTTPDNTSGNSPHFINYITGQDISNGETPKLSTNGRYRVNYSKKLIIDISATNLTGSSLIDGKYPKFNIRLGPIILNGVMQLRTSPDIQTKLSYTVTNRYMNSLNPNNLKTGNRYSIRIRPFNLSDYFPIGYGNGKDNQISFTLSGTYADSITNLSYILGSNKMVTLKWSYGTTAKYRIKLSLTDTYKDYNRIEYLIDGNIDSTFKLTNLIKNEFSDVYFNIPDINNSPDKFLTPGRSYNVCVAALKETILINQSLDFITSNYVYVYNIIPFTIPLRPISVDLRCGNAKFTFKVMIPNIENDPNYYITELYSNYYKYKYILIEYKNASVNTLTWETHKIPVSYPDNMYETIQTFDVSGNITNDTIYYNIRVSMGIYNEYNNQELYSNYTYPTVINNITYPELSGNIVYASIYPYKPSTIQNLYINKYSYSNNKIELYWNTPSYNGDAIIYTYTIQYSTKSNPTVWYDIYDTINGIANITDGSNSTGPIPNIATINTPITFILTCKSNIRNYNMRVSAIGYITPYDLNPIINRRAISDYSTVATIIL
jgi:hypothetical protein